MKRSTIGIRNKGVGIALLFLLYWFALAPVSNAQVIETLNVSSVTMTIDSLDTEAESALVKDIFAGYSSLSDFDLKGNRCNFTIDQSHAADIEAITSQLDAQGFVVHIDQMVDQTLSKVKVQSHDKRSKPDITEEEYIESLHSENDSD